MATINIATFNIRYDTAKDGSNAWPHRRQRVRDLIEYHEFDIVGVQEALAHQADFLAEGRLDYVGVGRDDGKRAGEFAPVFYDRNRFKPQESGTFWLSDTPDIVSRGWDAACLRVCTWVRLQSASDDFFVFNTHFDHRGTMAQEHSADLILQKIKQIAGATPFFLTGDFNLTPDTAPIRRIASELRDCREITETKPYGPAGTFNGFNLLGRLESPIDYIFISSGVRVFKYAALADNWDQRFSSDHLPVAVRAEITATSP